MIKVMGVKEMAYLTAKSEAKINPSVKLYLTKTGKFIISDQPQPPEYDILDFRGRIPKDDEVMA